MSNKFILRIALAGLFLSSSMSYAQTGANLNLGSAKNSMNYMMDLNSAVLSYTSNNQSYGNIWGRIKPRFQVREVNSALVRQHERYFASKQNYIDRTLKRGEPYLYYIVNELEKRNMPSELALLPFIESSYVAKAVSHVGATGLWQFMPATGRQYGLERTDWYDGRNDVYAATKAALDYLQFLHETFDDWTLAIAAYNCGEGRVLREIAKAEAKGIEPIFENLNLPTETRNYVPKLLAIRNIIQNPDAFNVSIRSIANQPYFEKVKIQQPIDFKAIARLAKISETELLHLNPGHKTPVWMPDDKRQLLLPKKVVAEFKNNLKAADPASLLSWQIYKSTDSESLADLASRMTLSVAELKKANGIRGNRVAKGQVILVPYDFIAIPQQKKSAQETDALMLASTSTQEPVYLTKTVLTNKTSNKIKAKNIPKYENIKVKSGMTLISLAKKHGTTVAELKKLNNLKSTDLKIGQSIKVASSSASQSNVKKAVNNKQSMARKIYVVKKGDTLGSVAKRHSISVKEIQKHNKNLSPKSLKVGTKITIRNS